MLKAILASLGLVALAMLCAAMVVPHWPAIASGAEFPSKRLIVASIGVFLLPAIIVYAWITSIRNNRTRLAMEDHLLTANPGGVVFSARAIPEYVASLNLLRARIGLSAIAGGRVPLGVVVGPNTISVWKSTGDLLISLPMQQVATIQVATVRTRIPGLRRTMPLECLQLDLLWAGQLERLYIPVTVRALGQASRADLAEVAERVMGRLAVRV